MLVFCNPFFEGGAGGEGYTGNWIDHLNMLRDKAIDIKMINILNDDKQNYPFCINEFIIC